MTILAGWGRYPRFPSELFEPPTLESAATFTLLHPAMIGRGNGRAYGDAAIGEV